MKFDNSQPIYRQIIDHYKKALIRGELMQGDKIPSQRDYAETARINPNTVQRAYREMEAMQMVQTLRGQGTFVIASEQMLLAVKEEMARELLDHFLDEMASLGYEPAQISCLLERELKNRCNPSERGILE